ncbi:RNase P/MRP, p29 subunit [Obba rivulosa]|uniref:RNase P/MRP, p29 subunit n=1 Tax=Obba rivulosa TaxID=1052685 RepID=A0A8E2DTW3_9APHY|nr:RNase P/MRP, p29 subunit [Obba rivulosa]
MSGPSIYNDVYTELRPANFERIKLTSTTPFTPTYVKSNVTRTSDPAQIYASRVQGRQILLENPARESKSKKKKEEKKAKRLAEKAKRDAAVMGRRDARRAEIWRLSPAETKFQLFLPLHTLWLGYMSELLSLSPPTPLGADASDVMPNVAGLHAKLVKADFHGAIITVRQSKNPCLVNLSGIVVHETENALKVVTRKDQLKLIPKQNSIFALPIPLFLFDSQPTSALCTSLTGVFGSPPADPAESTSVTVLDLPYMEFELYGNQFCFRAAERASRKFKHKETIEL